MNSASAYSARAGDVRAVVRPMVAGVSTGRHGAYLHMLNAGFRTEGQGVRMHRPNSVGFCRPRDLVIDDLR